MKRYGDCKFPFGSSSFFGAFRSKPFPTYYCPNETAATHDKVEIGLIVAVFVLLFLALIVSPGYRKWQRIFFLMKISGTLFVGIAIALSNFGYGWQNGSVRTKTPYRQFTKEEITADVGLHVGLRGINITLKGDPVKQAVDTNHEQMENINYNERFHWGLQQKRIGFGPYSNDLNQEFRRARWRGLPLPIIWIAEYFTLDGAYIRWGRAFRQAGFYTNAMLWTSFGLWIVANILFVAAPKAGTYVLGLIGIFLLISIIIYSAVVSDGRIPKLSIPFQGGSVELTYGWSFWLVLTAALFCLTTAVVLLIVEFRWPFAFYTFFNVNMDEELMADEAGDGRDGRYKLPKINFEKYRGSRRKRWDTSTYQNVGAQDEGVENRKDAIALEEIATYSC